MRIETILVVLAPNVENPSDPLVLVKVDDAGIGLLSSGLKEDETTLSSADKLLQNHLDVKARIGSSGWVELIPSPVVDNVGRVRNGERVIAIPYGCSIPKMIKPKYTNLTWMKLSELLFSDLKFVDDHQEIFLSVCTTL